MTTRAASKSARLVKGCYACRPRQDMYAQQVRSCAPLLLAHPQRGRMARQLETFAGVRDGRAIDFEDRYVLVEIVPDQQIFSVGRERRPFRHTADLDIADKGHLLAVDLQHR